MTNNDRPRPPVVILGGNANSLSIVRNLGRHGIDVNVSLPSASASLKSRFCKRRFPVPTGTTPESYWADLLLDEAKSKELEGSVVFALDDVSVSFLAKHREQLAQRFLLDDALPDLHLAMLDKQRTLELAAEAGVAAPKHLRVRSLDDLDRVRDEFEFPVVIKPVSAHLFRRHFPGIKIVVVDDESKLRSDVERFLEKDLEIIICEMIPGPDSQLSSYYTYHDADGQPQFHYTKRILRRHRLNCGKATYHIADWLPETAEAGKKFFSGIGFRGLGNVEFKHDLRDGRLKLIECNPRFTDAHELLVRGGIDTSLWIYNHLTGRENPEVDPYRRQHRLLFPLFDLVAYRDLKRHGKITTGEWLKSLVFPHAFPFFSVSDPMPFMAETIRTLKEQLGKR